MSDDQATKIAAVIDWTPTCLPGQEQVTIVRQVLETLTIQRTCPTPETEEEERKYRDLFDHLTEATEKLAAVLDMRQAQKTQEDGWNPKTGDHAVGTDLDGRTVVGTLNEFFAWSNETSTNTRAYLELASGVVHVVHTDSLRPAEPTEAPEYGPGSNPPRCFPECPTNDSNDTEDCTCFASGLDPATPSDTWQPKVGDRVEFDGEFDSHFGRVTVVSSKHSEAQVHDEETGLVSWFDFEDLMPAPTPVPETTLHDCTICGNPYAWHMLQAARIEFVDHEYTAPTSAPDTTEGV
jgi:hypothetical protein